MGKNPFHRAKYLFGRGTVCGATTVMEGDDLAILRGAAGAATVTERECPGRPDGPLRTLDFRECLGRSQTIAVRVG